MKREGRIKDSKLPGGIGTLKFVAVFWTVVWAVDVAKDIVAQVIGGENADISVLLMDPTPWWLAWFLLTPPILWVARRTDPDSLGWLPSAAVHLPISFFVTGFHVALATILFGIRNGDLEVSGLMINFRNMLFGFGLADMLTYWALVVGSYAFRFQQQYRDRLLASVRLEAKAAELQASFAKARLDALRMELNPHFLFNSLNSISGLVRRGENDSAVGMIAKLGHLLRLTLDSSSRPEVSLSEEIDLVRSYLEIEKIRFGDRLEVTIQCPDSLLDKMVPTLVMQPLVENAIKHGAAKRAGPSLVEIVVGAADGILTVRVRDSGKGTGEVLRIDEPAGDGIGLSNTRSRLEQLYGAAGTVELNRRPHGSDAVLTVPIRPVSGEQAS